MAVSVLTSVPLQRLCLEGWRSLWNTVHLRRILSLCSSTLEELAFEGCHISDHGTAPTPVTSTAPQDVHMEALRRLRLSYAESCLLEMPHIELPNLESPFCEHTRNHIDYIAPWVPATATELTLKVSGDSTPPRFSPAIRLCSLTIDICPTRRTSLYPSVVSWIGHCIDGLPCTDDLRHLNIHIMNTPRIWLSEPCYPARADYESLYDTLRPLHQGGALKHLDLTMEVNASEIVSDRIVYPVYRTRAEVATVKEVWGLVTERADVVVELTFKLTTSTRELVVLKYCL
ncbi:hypothetical protein BDN71DRAFT_1217396 [Pleurotus eryngii]|uniref:Uncharacterized protein n=1 Tax=Pleurotus eryngii TaxID=5323 RepID=A0A9P5ZQX0_PLEER|nr:hypothetical protein BDN71DRAFT_1217396 [Pleurotus eryngii]